ncbi:MAG: RRXRR domain-containing protein, partial [Desulfuromonadales bacterium]|nr:RRXRR domain-containing protein [Desulfuromonadales bacterium]
MQRVFVLDNTKQPLSPCSPARARMLLRNGKAAVYRRYPFTIVLKHRTGGDVQSVELKLDPGSKTTGVALVGNHDSANT